MLLTTDQGTPLRGRPPAIAPARNARSQERALWGRCWVPTAARPAPRKHGQRDPATGSKDGRLGEGERPTPDAPHNSERYTPPPGQPPANSAARGKLPAV